MLNTVSVDTYICDHTLLFVLLSCSCWRHRDHPETAINLATLNSMTNSVSHYQY